MGNNGKENSFRGTGETGGTGGTGETGGTRSFADLINEVRNERINMFASMTGGVGLSGDVTRNEHGEVISPISPEDEAQLTKLAGDKIDKMDLDELKVLIENNNRELTETLNKANAHNGNRAYTIGKALLRVNYLTESANLKNGFTNWMQDNLDRRTLSKRTCQKYMDIARIGDVLEYLPLGIEKLAALSPILKQMKNIDPAHPISDFVHKTGVNLDNCQDVEAMRFEIGLGMDMAKLTRNEIQGIHRDVVRRFRECGFELVKKDFDAMKVAMETGGSPTKYLEQVIRTRKRPGATHKAEGATPPKNLMEQAQEIRDTVAKLMKASTITGDIEVKRIDDLIQDLEALKSRLKSSTGRTLGGSNAEQQPDAAGTGSPLPASV